MNDVLNELAPVKKMRVRDKDHGAIYDIWMESAIRARTKG